MPSVGTLWAPTGSAIAIRAAAAYAGVEIDLPASYVHFEDNKKPDFLANFPHGKVPAFEGADGFRLFEGLAIGKYIARLAPNSGLLGNNAKEAALIDQWLQFSSTEIGAVQLVLYQLTSGILTPYNKQMHNTFVERQVRSLTTLNQHLQNRTYLVTERISLADIAVATAIQATVAHSFDAELRKKLPNAVRFMETVVNNPKMKEIFGETIYIDKAKQFVAQKKA